MRAWSMFAICCAIIAIIFPIGSQGYKCYDDSCTGTPQGRVCRTSSDQFGFAQRKLNCQDGCKYWTIKDENGRPVQNQAYKTRACWDTYYDGGNKYKAGTCTEEIHDGKVHRFCVCAEDWCNAPEKDAAYDAMDSSSASKLMGGMALLLSAIGIVVGNKL